MELLGVRKNARQVDEFSQDVAKGAVIRYVLTNELQREMNAPIAISTPQCVDPTVIERIADREQCPDNATCATFAAIKVGSTQVSSAGPSGAGFASEVLPTFIVVR